MLWLLKQQLKSKSAATRRHAAEQLSQSPDRGAFDALRTALGDSDAAVRRLAATALGRIEDDRAVEPLLAALRDPNPEVQQAVILSLKRSADSRVVTALVPLLRHPNAGARGQAALVLDFLGWRPGNRDDEIWFFVARGKFSRAAGFGATALPALDMVLDSGPFSLAVAVVHALVGMRDEKAIRLILKALRSNEPAVCVAAVDALAKIGSAQAVEPLIGMLRHQNSQVRLTAVEALGNLRAGQAVESLCLLLGDKLWEVRRATAEALGRLKNPRAMEPLTKLLSDSDADVREAAAISLGSLGDRRAISPLVLALKDSNSGVRRIAAGALSRINPQWSSSAEAQIAIGQLKSALEEEDADLRYFVGQLLVGLGTVKSSDAAHPPLEEINASTAENRRKLAVGLFVAILCDSDRDLRQAAAESLGQLADRRAEPALTHALADPDTGVRFFAEQALRAVKATT